MTTSHTPGPWQASSYEGGWDCIRDGHGTIIAKLALNEPANAQLIAAAPDLLAALELAMTWINNWDPTFVQDVEWQETDNPKIRAAIAKARGQAGDASTETSPNAHDTHGT